MIDGRKCILGTILSRIRYIYIVFFSRESNFFSVNRFAYIFTTVIFGQNLKILCIFFSGNVVSQCFDNYFFILMHCKKLHQSFWQFDTNLIFGNKNISWFLASIIIINSEAFTAIPNIIRFLPYVFLIKFIDDTVLLRRLLPSLLTPLRHCSNCTCK